MSADRLILEEELLPLLRERLASGQSIRYLPFRGVSMLPLLRQDTGKDARASDILYEPDSEQVFDAIIPEYVGGILYGALCESRAAEQAARRSAMDSATSNADDLIADLSLKFNRARQAAITQEITEIVAGS